MKTFTKTVLTLACTALVIGCASNKPKVDDKKSTPGAGAGAQSQGVDTRTGSASAMDQRGAGAMGAEAELLAKRVIYFDYDSAQIRSDFISVVNAHGRNLAENANARIRLEGHADERGSREYNIALSEYRAEAVRNLMKFQGVRAGQIETVAYGEEKPAELGHNETAWSRNRRVEIVYEAQ